MWARVGELGLAIWLAASAYLFPAAPVASGVQLNAMLTAALVGLCSSLAFHPRLEKVHLLNLAVAAWLVVCAFRLGSDVSTAQQNWMMVGLLLGMLAIVPSHSSKPPRAWREFSSSEPRA